MNTSREPNVENRGPKGRRESSVESREQITPPGFPAPGSPLSTLASGPSSAAFTLLEVMIAGGILFMCLFAILALVANGLQNARTLQRMPVDPAAMLAAEASLNQRLAEGADSGDFGNLYPDYRWSAQTNQVSTNGLFQVDFVVYRRSGSRSIESHLSILLYRPDLVRRPSGGPS